MRSPCSTESIEIGNEIEAALLNASIPCRLAHGRALSEEPIVAYVLAALRVIAYPHDDVVREGFFATTLPSPLMHDARARARSAKRDITRALYDMSKRLPKGDANGKRIRLALSRYRNLTAVERAHASIDALIADLLSQNVKPRSPLEERHEELTDPADHAEVRALVERFRAGARSEIATSICPDLAAPTSRSERMLAQVGVTARIVTEASADGDAIAPNDAPTLGLVLATFKAAQMLEIGDSSDLFRDFTAIDIETTDRDTDDRRDRRDRGGPGSGRGDRRDVRVACEARRSRSRPAPRTNTASAPSTSRRRRRLRTSGRSSLPSAATTSSSPTTATTSTSAS